MTTDPQPGDVMRRQAADAAFAISTGAIGPTTTAALIAGPAAPWAISNALDIGG